MKARRYGFRRCSRRAVHPARVPILLLFAQAAIELAPAGLLDPSFDPGAGANGPINAIALQGDGRIVIAGAFTTFHGAPHRRIARLNPDGSLDPNFNPGAGANDDINTVAIQADGRIVIGGFFTQVNYGTSRSGIARLTADGSLDPTFDPGAGVEQLTVHPQVHATALQANGAIVIGGYFQKMNNVNRDGIARLNADGSVDLIFDPGTGLAGFVALAVAAQPNGQVLVGGIFETVNGVQRKSIARLNADGSVDDAFSVPNGGIGGSNSLERVYALAVQPDGRMLIGGDFTIVAGQRRQHLARLNTDGSLDDSFDAGLLYLNGVSAVLLQPDGRVVAGGSFQSVDGLNRSCIARLMSDGSLDLGFDPGAGVEVAPFAVQAATVNALALDPNGRLILAGNFDLFDAIARTNIARLGPGSATNLAILNFAPYPVNAAVSEGAGTATVTINRIGSHNQVVTVNYATRDGTAKAGSDYLAQTGLITFDIGERTKTISIPILDDAVPEDDEQFYVVLANVSDGAVLGDLSTSDVTIVDDDPGVEFGAATFTVNEMDPSVTITVRRVGPTDGPFSVDFATANGTATAGKDYLARSGTLRFRWMNWWETVATFTIPILENPALPVSKTILLSLSNPIGGVLGARSNATVVIAPNCPCFGANDTVLTILPLPDGKVIIGGDFTFVDGIPRNRIARLNPDATLDPSFDPGSGADGSVYALALQSDGQILLGGSFTNIDGASRAGIARLQPEGSLDTTFQPGPGVQGSSHGALASVRAIALQANGQILIGGFFSQYGGLARSGIARLNPDASVDDSFSPSYGQDAVFPMAVPGDGKILAAGFFTDAGQVVEFARLNTDGSVDANFQVGAGQFSEVHVLGMAVQNDGRILLDGYFLLRGASWGFSRAVRFYTNGSIDASYASTDDVSGYAATIALQPDNKLIVAGVAASIQRPNISRLNTDGSLDATFNSAIGPEGNVLAVAVQPAGTILIGGSFKSVNGLTRFRIARLNPDGTVFGSLEFNPPTPLPGGQFRLTSKGPSGIAQVIEASSNLTNWLPVYTNTSPDSPLDFLDPEALQWQRRFYRAVMKP